MALVPRTGNSTLSSNSYSPASMSCGQKISVLALRRVALVVTLWTVAPGLGGASTFHLYTEVDPPALDTEPALITSGSQLPTLSGELTELRLGTVGFNGGRIETPPDTDTEAKEPPDASSAKYACASALLPNALERILPGRMVMFCSVTFSDIKILLLQMPVAKQRHLLSYVTLHCVALCCVVLCCVVMCDVLVSSRVVFC